MNKAALFLNKYTSLILEAQVQGSTMSILDVLLSPTSNSVIFGSLTFKARKTYNRLKEFRCFANGRQVYSSSDYFDQGI